MLKHGLLKKVILVAVAAASLSWAATSAKAAGRGQPTDWQRFYYYPYVYYPHNFEPNQGSYDHLYYRYPPKMQIPVYNKLWYNYYPEERPYHQGNHFHLDVF